MPDEHVGDPDVPPSVLREMGGEEKNTSGATARKHMPTAWVRSLWFNFRIEGCDDC